MTSDSQGITTCARYAFAPNYFHYCGPEKQEDLKTYVTSSLAAKGLTEILHQFETLYPYLVLIASANRIHNAFDPRVVEAYWLGNALTRRVPISAYGTLLTETLTMKKRLPAVGSSAVMEKAVGGLPHHTSHVLNLFIRTGHHAITHTLSTLDECRISWGQIMNIDNKFQRYIVKTRPLEYDNDKLRLGAPGMRTVTSVGVQPTKGQWVSLHWGFICDILSVQQVRNLNSFTATAIAYANTNNIVSL